MPHIQGQRRKGQAWGMSKVGPKAGEKGAQAPPVLVIAGATASGKSRLAIDAAEALGGVVINADSMQIYRELSVLTARPGAADRARVPHRLYGVLSGSERCSAELG